jgi:hypothetical protein
MNQTHLKTMDTRFWQEFKKEGKSSEQQTSTSQIFYYLTNMSVQVNFKINGKPGEIGQARLMGC